MKVLALAILAACGSPAGPDGAPDFPPPISTPDARIEPVDIKIKHVVVVVKENHTFDNYFGSFPGADGATVIQTSTGMLHAPRAPDKTPRDLCHAHDCALTDLAGGAMNGW